MQVGDIARVLIENMEAVHQAVEGELNTREPGLDTTVTLGVVSNSMAHGRSREVRTVRAIVEGQRADLHQLRTEPFIARVVAESDDGQRHTFFFARANPLRPSQLRALPGKLATYGTAIGRLAEREPGDEYTVPLKNGLITYTVIERVRLRPSLSSEGWDGRNDQIERDDGLVATLDSLRVYLSQVLPPEQVEDLLATIDAEAGQAAAVREGLQRAVRDRMSLRDEAILDKYQGEVFRLPLMRRLMLSGPPGTGKTTTLIKRIAQKSRVEEATEEEQELVADAAQLFRSGNWVMYTPTELLRLYLQEAFASEGVPAPNDRVRTWTADRRRLAKDVVNILKSGSRNGFTLEETAPVLIDETSTGQKQLFEAFERAFRDQTCADYKAVLAELVDNADPDLKRLAERMRRFVGETQVVFDRLFSVVDYQVDLAQHERALEVATKREVDGRLNKILAPNRALIDDLVSLLASQPSPQGEESDEEEVAPLTARPGDRAGAVNALRRAVEASAKELSDGRSRTRTGRNRRVLEWLGDRLKKDDSFRALGAQLVVLENVRFLKDTHRNLIDQVRVEYGKFRGAAVRAGKWFRLDARSAVEKGKVGGAEVDVMLLLMLRHARRFLERNGGRDLEPSATTPIAVLNSVKGEYVTQVLVDEVTDFSPVQVACMLELAWPKLRSLFVCGDIRQRVTPWGIRSFADLQWVSSDFDERKISIGYRQTKRLSSFGAALGGIAGDVSDLVRQPSHVQDADIAPLLVEKAQGATLARWLCDRIRDVERAVGKVPSIAIFVDGDDRIDPLLGDLRPLLDAHNIEMVGCKEGRVVGTDGQVRVFDVQHIKGLEFEAVFFVGVDLLATRVPDLFDKFLYVGTTRAATYLGITCEGSLPSRLELLRPLLESGGWS